MHKPVLLKEVISLLNPKSGSVYVDCTLGSGGHTIAILNSGAKVYGIDRDLEAVEEVKTQNSKVKNKELKVIWTNFRNLGELIKGKVSGVLFDLGLSSEQLDSPVRGFSYRFNGLLDMRMDRSKGVPCYKLLKEMGVEDLEYILLNYGEERYFRRIAREIVQNKPETTEALKEIIRRITPPSSRTKILARVWQGLRIFVNDELACLRDGLVGATKILKVGGRICVISYHSLEDRIVKQYFRDELLLKVITNKPICPSEEEISGNPRSRSAKLRCAEKIGIGG
ncbi:MAG: 16S rRNA (cytosine(1402)-N(4))-methyltransferase RsmH [Candidatus Stahlbacteria bacterium]|nr:16S rRNA (cytosine(1402)-N(4))-methyltransferase RsmH [Candidatus Stahlbacteria bacterium]